MNDVNMTKALVVYVPPKSQKKYAEHFKKLVFKLGQAFHLRKRLYFFFFALYLCFAFFGCCISFANYRFLSIALGVINDLFKVSVYITVCFCLFLSGFSVFGRIIPVVFTLVSALIVGILLCSSVICIEHSYFAAIEAIARLSIISFASILISVEIFSYSKNALLGIANLFLPSKMLVYSTVCTGAFMIVYVAFNSY